jgi:hypothetical protein
MTVTERVPKIEITRREHRLNANQLMRELISNRVCLGLLRFFVSHPDSRFNKLAILHALDEDGTLPEVERDLNALIGDGVVRVSVENGACYYSLTCDEPTRHLVLNLAEFDWHQWQRLDHYYVADRRNPA